jgi:hypothetical protein
VANTVNSVSAWAFFGCYYDGTLTENDIFRNRKIPNQTEKMPYSETVTPEYVRNPPTAALE